VFLLVSTLSLVANEKERAARQAALEEADRVAFEANMATYEHDVRPFLTKHCIACHGTKKQKGDLSLETLDSDMKASTSASRWATVREYLENGEMPPEDEPRPAPEEIQKVLAWTKAEMKRARRNFTRRLKVVHGNEVPHELLFDSTHKAEFEVAPRVRRRSPEIYESFRKEQAKGFENLVGNPFTPDPRYLFKDMGAPKVDVPTTSQLLRNALTILERQTGHTIVDGQLKPLPHARKEYLVFIDPSKPFETGEREQAIKMQFQRVLGRAPKDDELKRFLALMEKNIQDAGRTSAVRYTLAAVYLLPDAIFRWELGSRTENGKVRLTPEEIAAALAYSLTDRQPADWLIKDAANGRLETSDGVAAAVKKILDDPKLEKPRILRFFHEFFEYPKAIEVFKNSEEFRFHKARVLVSDTDNLVRWILERDQNVLKELLTTNRSFVNTRYDSNKEEIVRYESNGEIHRSYSLPPDWKWTDEQPIEMTGGLRAGILTQPAWLVAWSMNTDNHAILRGKWIRERLLGNVVPDIPITVDAQLPEDPEMTLRERMHVTREPYCWECHRLMNPVGLPFETYDHFGRFRARELGKPVDATGRIDLVSKADTSHDVKVDGSVDFVHQLAKSERVEQVFVRHVFRFFTGRNENLGDGPSLRAAHQAYQKSGGSFRALVTAILSSESFLYRTPNLGPAESDPAAESNQSSRKLIPKTQTSPPAKP
jgi:hypothetical protein